MPGSGSAGSKINLLKYLKMENVNLKMMWQIANATNQGASIKNENIEEIIRMNHSKTIAKVLSDIKLKIMLYSGISAIYIGLMLYAFVYLGLNLSFSSIVPLLLAGLFLFIQTTKEINRLIVYTRKSDSLSVKESIVYFRKKLNQIKTIDFISFLILFYLMAIIVIRGYIQDIGGFKNLSGTNEVQPLIGIFIVILLLTPWIIKYQNNQRYRKTESSLDDSTNQLKDED
jgi:hypothetical protein